MIRLAITLALLIAVPALAGAADPSPAERAARIERATVRAVQLESGSADAESLAQEMARLHVPAVSVAVVQDGQIAWAKAYGATGRDGAPATPDTLFQAASISKAVTAVAALRLVEQGRLTLDAPVNAQLTSWRLPGPGADAVTLRQLLTHTAGVTVHGFDGYAAGATVPTTRQLLGGVPPANSAAVTVDTTPGGKWRYSGGGYQVIQQLLVDRTGTPFADLMRRLVLAPAGMTRSGFDQPLLPARLANAALPHDSAGKPVAGGPHRYPELAAAGLWTTPGDLARFVVAVQRAAAGRPSALLSKAMATALLTPGLGHWGLGVELRDEAGTRSFVHGGANRGYMSYLAGDVALGTGAVVMTNGDNGAELAQDLLRSIAREYRWPGFHPIVRRAVALDPALAARLVGTYEIAGLGTFSIAQGAVGLTLSLREGQSEPIHAASPTELFVLSQDARLLLSPEPGSINGRVVAGSFDLPFTRQPDAR